MTPRPRGRRVARCSACLASLLFLLLAAAEPALAVEPAPAAPAASPARAARRPAMRGDHGLLFLADGRELEGTLVTTSDNGDVVELADGKRLFLPGHAVIGVAADLGPDPWAGVGEGQARAVLHDGGEVTGRLLARDTGSVELETPEGERRTFRADQVKALYGPAGPLPPLRGGMRPARIRGLWAQTARVLDPGEVVLTSSEVASLQAAAGVVRWTMFSAETTFPDSFGSRFGASATVRATLGGEVLPRLHAAAGVEGWFSGAGKVVSTFGAVTYGDEGRWLSAYLGPPPTGVDRLGHLGDRIAALSGAWQVLPRVSLLAEAWSGTRRSARDRMLGVAARLRLWRLDLDAGALTATDRSFVPFLAVSGTLVSP